MTNQLQLSNKVEVQFWNLMLHGHIDDAKKLLPQVHFQPDNYTKSPNPAVLSLWAAQSNNLDVARATLKKSFPDFDWSNINTKNFTAVLNEVFQEVGETRFKDLIFSVLKHISKINLNRSERSTAHENLAINCCVAALKFMLNKQNRTFDCITPTTRLTAEKLLTQLIPYANRTEQSQSVPKCLTTLMNVLDKKMPEQEEALLTPARPLLPSSPLRASYHAYDTCGSSQHEKESFEYFRPRSPLRSH